PVLHRRAHATPLAVRTVGLTPRRSPLPPASQRGPCLLRPQRLRRAAGEPLQQPPRLLGRQALQQLHPPQRGARVGRQGHFLPAPPPRGAPPRGGVVAGGPPAGPPRPRPPGRSPPGGPGPASRTAGCRGGRSAARSASGPGASASPAAPSGTPPPPR